LSLHVPLYGFMALPKQEACQIKKVSEISGLLLQAQRRNIFALAKVR
jgi:hypothetical protein